MSKPFWFSVSALFVVACGAPSDDEADGPPMFGGLPPGGGGAAVTGGGGTGNSPSMLGAGQGGSIAQGGASNVPSGNGGEGTGNVSQVPANGGSGNTNGGAANGGSAGNGNPGNGGSPGNGGGNGDPGGFVSVPVNGGASAAFICPDGQNFGNPLQGMGAVTTVNAPQGNFFAFIEGPIWSGSANRLFFSDNASDPERIFELQAPFTTPAVFMANSGSNGLALDNEDNLLLADERVRRITRVNPTSAQVIETVVPTANFTPNDLILRSDDNLYFTDPQSGFYRVSPSGQVSGAIRGGNAPNAPNGIVLSPDENTVYVGDVQARFVAAFDLEVDGSVDMASGRRFTETTGDTVDGMAVDCAGNLYVGTRTGVEVYSSQGTFIGNVPTGEASNATFGGTDRRTLFVTSRAQLKFVTLAVPGLPD